MNLIPIAYIQCLLFKNGYLQSHEKEEDPAKGGDTGNVPVAHGGHGHHQEVDRVPVGQVLAVQKVGRVSGVLKLNRKKIF